MQERCDDDDNDEDDLDKGGYECWELIDSEGFFFWIYFEIRATRISW